MYPCEIITLTAHFSKKRSCGQIWPCPLLTALGSLVCVRLLSQNSSTIESSTKYKPITTHRRPNSQHTPIHAGVNWFLSAAVAFGAPVHFFVGGSVAENSAAAARPARRRALLQVTLALSLVLSSLKSECYDFSIFSAVMPRSPALCLTCYTEFCHTLNIFCNLRPKVWERIHLLQLFILNECYTLCHRSPLPWSCRHCRLYLRLTRSRWPANSCSSACAVANRMISSA